MLRFAQPSQLVHRKLSSSLACSSNAAGGAFSLFTLLLYRSVQLIEAAGTALMIGLCMRPCAWLGCPRNMAHTLCPSPQKMFLSLESLSLTLASPEGFVPCLSQAAAAHMQRACCLLSTASLKPSQTLGRPMPGYASSTLSARRPACGKGLLSCTPQPTLARGCGQTAVSTARRTGPSGVAPGDPPWQGRLHRCGGASGATQPPGSRESA